MKAKTGTYKFMENIDNTNSDSLNILINIDQNQVLFSVKNECCHNVVEMFAYNVLLQGCGNVPVTFLEYVETTFSQLFLNAVETLLQHYIVSWVGYSIFKLFLIKCARNLFYGIDYINR